MSAVSVLQPPRQSGAPGYSAYQLALQAGFVGTQAQWLASLVGPAADPTALNAAVANATTSATSASGSATAAFGSMTAAAASATAAGSSATTAGNSVTAAANQAANAGTSATAALNSAGASAGSAMASANSATLAQAWAMQTSGTVDGTSYSAKWYAQLAQNWASQATGTVDGTSYSARYYALQAAQSAAQAAGAGITPSGAFTVGHFLLANSTTGGSAVDGGAPAAVATSGSASDLGTGTLPAARLPTNGVANGNLAQMPASTLKGNTTGAAGNASDVTPSAVLDTFGSTQGTVLYRGGSGWAALGPGTAGQVLQSGGAVANPSWTATAPLFTVARVVAKSAAYTAVIADSGTMFDLTGSFALTLPAASGGTAAVPLWYHFRKRDGSGRCTVAPNGSDTIEGVNAAISLYQERVTLVSFGSGWLFPPGGRERVVDVVPLNSVFSAVSALTLLTGFDADVETVEIFLDNMVPSSAVGIQAQVYQGGAYTASGYSYSGSYGAGNNDVSTTATFFAVGPQGGSTNPATYVLTLQNVQATVAKQNSIHLRGASVGANAAAIYYGQVGTAGAYAGVKIYPASATFSGTYGMRITRR